MTNTITRARSPSTGSTSKRRSSRPCATTQATGVVTNLSSTPMLVAGDVPGVVPPWKSTILCGGSDHRGRSRFDHRRSRLTTNLGGLLFDGWDWFGNRMPEFPRQHTALHFRRRTSSARSRSTPGPSRTIPTRRTRPTATTSNSISGGRRHKTDAVIHNTHAFLEIHTQIFGLGRIQIYGDQAGTKLYREISTAKGDTHDPIVRVNGPPDLRLSLAPRLDRHRRDLDGDRASSRRPVPHLTGCCRGERY